MPFSGRSSRGGTKPSLPGAFPARLCYHVGMGLFAPEEKRRLSNARKGLTPKRAECVRLVAMGMSHMEAASVLGCSRATADRALASIQGRIYMEALQEVADAYVVRAAAAMSVVRLEEALRACKVA